MRIRLRFLIPLGFALAAGCAACQPCRGQTPSPQADDRAPLPPRAPRPGDEELPPLPVPSPPAPSPTSEGTGRVRRTTTTTTSREVEGQAIVIEQHAPGVIVIGSSGIPVGAQGLVPAMAVQPQAAPVIPLPVPDSLLVAAGRRIAGGLYYAATGNCPPPRAQRARLVTLPAPAPSTSAPAYYVVPDAKGNAVALPAPQSPGKGY